ncbi:MAG TPA: phosphotransferase [Solirubrobacteraceae bacterium]|jgi:thiamine kinase-like enzyme|nr:phosphotransferase [Solirubrobacteraceae bacterium]
MGEIDGIVAELEPLLGTPSGEPVALEGGITNHNFRVRLGGEEYVIRRHGRETERLGIDRGAERMASEAAAALGIAPALVASVEGGLVTRFVQCTTATPAQVRERVSEIALALAGFHALDLQLPAAFWVPDLLARYEQEVRSRGGQVPEEYARAQAVVARIAAAVPLGEPRPCHNDLLAGNVILASGDGRVMIVDWEYAGMGHPYFDLGNLAVNNGYEDAEEEALLAAYHGERADDRRRARLKLMRIVSDAREAAWGVAQSVISDLDFDFGGYASEHLDRLAAAVEGADFEEWLAAA